MNIAPKKQLRYYQRNAIDAIYNYDFSGNPLVSMATGTGKSVVIATFCREALERWPDTRIIVAVTSKELVMQNHAEMLEIWPDAPATVYSAGAGKKDMTGKIIFCTIQSIWRHAFKLNKSIDLLICDEVQDVSEKSGTMYRKFIEDLKVANPEIRVIGLSATVFRLSQGLLTDGENALFDKVIYDYGMLQGIKDGFLSPLVSKHMNQHFDLTGVGTRNGDYIPGQLERAVDKDPVTKACVDEIVAYGADRKCWLAFCTGIAHAMHVRDEIRSRGFTCETVSSETPKEERDEIFRQYKAGNIRCLTNVNILSKGSNIPQIDLIASLRPSKSAGLVVQACGRGTRLSPGKTDCMLLDFANWLSEHGPIDMIQPKSKNKKGGGEAPVKTCPECKTIVFAGLLVCPTCNFEFPKPKPEIHKEASTAAALSIHLKPICLNVVQVSYYRHHKEGKPDSLRVEYLCSNLKTVNSWWCFEHTNNARTLACMRWNQAAGTKAPNTVTESLQRSKELKRPKTITIKIVGKFNEIIGVDYE